MKMRGKSWVIRGLVVVALAAMVSACGDSPTAPTQAVVGGSWQGTLQSAADGPGTFTLQLGQDGLNVAGQMHLTQGGITNAQATFVGKLASATAPTTMTYTVTYDFGLGCDGTFTGSANVDANSHNLNGSFAGQNCVHDFAGTLQANKLDQ